MLTVRNSRGADLYAATDDETIVLPIQSKALSKRDAVSLGSSLDNLRSAWWIITINANTDAPKCYVLTIEEVKASANRNVNAAGIVSYWLERKSYELPIYLESWDRMDSPVRSIVDISN
jgi:hypothetical protein